MVCEISQNDSIGVPLPNATIRLLHAGDSSLIKGVVSDSNGKFLLQNINQGDYILSVSYMGFTTSYTTITSGSFSANSIIDLGNIELKESEIMLDGVVVEGRIPELIIKGDTLEYNPAAFSVQEGAVVEDLLKNLPGIEVDANGRISTFAGKEIRRVYVNGKEFFGNDPKMATKNIPIEIIDKVQVIEKKTEQSILTGVDSGERETVINLTVKKDNMNILMGNGTTSGGTLLDNQTDEALRYNMQGNLMKFTDNFQTSIIANANNINNQSSSSTNVLVSGIANTLVVSSGSFTPIVGSGNTISIAGGGNGITNSNSFGFNIASTVSEKLRTSGDIIYNASDSYAIRNSFRTNLMADSVSYRKNASDSRSASRSLGFNARMEYKPDSLLTMVFAPRISFNFSDSHDAAFEETLAGDSDSTQINRSNSNSGTNSSGVGISENLTITRLFTRKGRRLGLTMNGNLNHNSGNGTNKSFNEFFLQPERTMRLDQESATSSNTGSFDFRISYVEPLKENLSLSVFYDYRMNKALNLRETFDYNEANGAYSALNTDYSKSMENQSVSQNVGVSLNATKPKYTFNIGINMMPSSTQSATFIRNGNAEGQDSILNRLQEHKVVNYSPQVNFTYRLKPQTSLAFTYNGSTRQPSVSQLDPTPNITNPLNITSGNPELLPSFTNSMSLRFSNSKIEKQRSLSSSLDYSFTINEIISFTNYEPGTGIQYTAPINENGSWNMSGSVMFNTPIDRAKRLKISTTSRLSYNNQIGYTTVERQSYRNISGTLNVTENVTLSYMKNKFNGQLRASVNFSNTNNTFKSRLTQQNVNYNLSYNTQFTFPWKIVFNSDINYRIQRGLSTGYNKDEVLWNMNLSRLCLKNNMGALRLTWNDILQKRSNISHNITANYIEDSEFNSLTSYIMFSFSYRFNIKKRDMSQIR